MLSIGFKIQNRSLKQLITGQGGGYGEEVIQPLLMSMKMLPNSNQN